MSHSATDTGPGILIPPPVIFVLVFVAGLVVHQIVPVNLTPHSWSQESVVIAWILFGVGALIGLWAMTTFIRARTAILPHHRASLLVNLGPYRYSRNPMYAGLTLMYSGFALWVNSLWPLAFLPVSIMALWVFVIRKEEAYLSREFGNAYDEYRNRVRRWI